MSFILDALRKSEHERRMETAPDIMHTPVAVDRPGLPAWTVIVIAALAAALAAVSLYSWIGRSENRPAAPPVTRQLAPEPASAPAMPAIPDPAPAPDQLAETANPVSNAPVAAPAAATVPASPPVAPAQPAAPQFDPATLPAYAALIGDGLNLGVLQMQLHVHSTAAANRFVVINGSRRREGDQLSEGPVVEEIVPEGAILSYQGRVFLLTPN